MRKVTFATGEDVLVLENAWNKTQDSTTNHKWELSCEGDFAVHNLNQARRISPIFSVCLLDNRCRVQIQVESPFFCYFPIFMIAHHCHRIPTAECDVVAKCDFAK